MTRETSVSGQEPLRYSGSLGNYLFQQLPTSETMGCLYYKTAQYEPSLIFNAGIIDKTAYTVHRPKNDNFRVSFFLQFEPARAQK